MPRAWVEANLGEAKEAPKMGAGAGAFGDFRMRSGLCLATILAASGRGGGRSAAFDHRASCSRKGGRSRAMRAATTTAPRSCCSAIRA